ncbi:MAG: DNA starvation/stationary phase protection protein [Pseudomonadota bacterium]|nr:DNA starvation/stationary phase protection protein [Pseudomonadota bacterium]MDQ8001275.1 DNA starvation/stationary phase protection protein [Pseudomonadota bacterium]MDQ8017368.1 DNA starvation/stationary phase protection protein [Pseudomonadota bacterium]
MAKNPKDIKKNSKTAIADAPAAGKGTVPAKGGERVAPESGSRSAPIINIGIDRQDRAAIAEGLSRVLADTYTLYLTTHNFHWNVTGPHFNSLHAMFMAQYTELWNATDVIAERIRALGHYAPGSYAEFSKIATVPDVPQQPPKAMEMVRILVKGHETVSRIAREFIPVAEEAGDDPTADMLTARCTVHDQTAWMLRSLLEE